MQPTVTIKRLGWLAAATIVLGVLIGWGAGLLTPLLYGVEHAASATSKAQNCLVHSACPLPRQSDIGDRGISASQALSGI